MKIIKLNESQFGRVFEGVTDSNFGTSQMVEYPGKSVISNQPTITDKDGSKKKANPIDSDDFADELTPQQWGFVGYNRNSNAI